MNARTYLSQYMVLNHRIEGKIAILNELQAAAEKTNFVMSDVVVSHSRNNHAMEEVIIRIQELKDQIAKDMLRLLDLQDELMKQIEKVPDWKMRRLLEMRYIFQKTWEEIADSLNYSESNVFKLHKRALQEIKVPEISKRLQ